MRFIFMLLTLGILSTAYAQDKGLSNSELRTLTLSLAKKLHSCRQLKSKPELYVEVENRTKLDIDTKHLAEQIHGYVEGKTHALSGESTQYDVKTQMNSRHRFFKGGEEDIFTLHAQLQQAGEILCSKTAVLKRRSGIP